MSASEESTPKNVRNKAMTSNFWLKRRYKYDGEWFANQCENGKFFSSRKLNNRFNRKSGSQIRMCDLFGLA